MRRLAAPRAARRRRGRSGGILPLAIALCLGAAGCGRSALHEGVPGDGGADLTAAVRGDGGRVDLGGPDLSCVTCGGPCVDLRSDDRNCGACGRPCAGQRVCRAAVCVGREDRQLIVELLRLPHAATDFAVDLDGNGQPDNGLAGWLQALVAATAVDDMPDSDVNLSLLLGDVVELMELPPAEAPDSGPVAILQGQPQPTPDFSGTGFFFVDSEQPAAVLAGGAWAAKAYAFRAPAGAPPPVMPLVIPQRTNDRITLPLTIHRLDFQVTSFGIKGEIHGSIREDALEGPVAVSLAQVIEGLATRDARTPFETRKRLLERFDIGDGRGGSCTSTDGTVGRARDNQVAACEVRASAASADLWRPDLHVYDGAGRFAPGQPPDPRANDALSFGIAFAAAPATFL